MSKFLQQECGLFYNEAFYFPYHGERAGIVHEPAGTPETKSWLYIESVPANTVLAATGCIANARALAGCYRGRIIFSNTGCGAGGGNGIG